MLNLLYFYRNKEFLISLKSQFKLINQYSSIIWLVNDRLLLPLDTAPNTKYIDTENNKQFFYRDGWSKKKSKRKLFIDPVYIKNNPVYNSEPFQNLK